MNAPDTASAWRRLSPRSPLAALGRWVPAFVIVFVPVAVSGASWWGPAVYVPIVLAVLVGETAAWRTTRWRLSGAVLEKRHGVFRRSFARVPLSQVQAVDVVRPGAARLLGLAELRLRTGSQHGAVRLRFLPLGEATELRARLLVLAAPAGASGPVPSSRVQGPTPDTAVGPPAVAAPEPERLLVTTPTPRLLAGLVLSVETLALVAGLVLLLEFVGVRGAGTDLLALGAAVWRRFNAQYRLQVAEAADGLRVRGGLIATAAETIRPGRVQAVRLVEPLLWRPFGWCRLQVALAGHEHIEGERDDRRRQLRTVVAVGGRPEAESLLARLLPDLPSDRLRPPRRARLKAPLRFRNLAWGRTDLCAVTRSGVLARVTSWVPLAKVQSLRRVEGPIQRRLRLATVQLDTAGRGVHAALRDRDRDEADASLDELVTLCRRARRTGSIAARPTRA